MTTRVTTTPTPAKSPAGQSSAPGVWEWRIHTGLAGLAAAEAEWNQLADAAGLFPTADARWVRCWWSAFGQAAQVLELQTLRCGGRLAAVMPLVRRRGWIATRTTLSNGHVPFVEPAVAQTLPQPTADDHAAALAGHLCSCADVIELDRLRAGGPLAAAMPRAAQNNGSRLVREWRAANVVMQLPGSWDELRRRLSRNLDQDTARKRRRLERCGRLALEVVTGGPELRAALDCCYALEARGWKGQRGSPIASRPDTLRFYTQLAEEQALAGRFALYLLKLEEQIIAFEYCLRGLGQLHMLKLSFEPGLAADSPGNVLRYLLLEHEADRGEVREYHFGPAYRADDWKLRWASETETLVRLRVYAPRPAGTAAYYVGPWLGERVRALPLPRRAVRFVRGLVGCGGATRRPCATAAQPGPESCVS